MGQNWNALSSSFKHQATGRSGFIKNFKLFENNESWQSSWVVFFVDSSSTEAAETGFRTQPVATAVSATGV